MTTYRLEYADNAQSTLAAGISAASPSFQLVSGGGALFPSLAVNQAFVCTLVKNGNPNIWETVLVTGRSGDNCTGLVRNYENNGVGPLSWNAGDIVFQGPTAYQMNNMAQFVDLQAQQTNYTIDVGSTNHYAAILNPLPNGHVVGMPIRFKAANDSINGGSTFNDGVGVQAFVLPNGDPIRQGDIFKGGIYTSVWDGTNFQLIDSEHPLFTQLNGSIANSQVPLSAVLQWESSLAIAFGQLTGQLLQAQVASNLNFPGAPTTTTQTVGDHSTKIATTDFINSFVQRGTVHVGDVNSPVGGSVTFPHAFATAAVVSVSLIDANNHGASAVAAIDGIPTTGGFTWAAREIASAIEDAYIHWIAVAS